MKRFRTFIITFVLCLDVFKKLKLVSTLNITVLHLNDIHARIEQTNKYTGFCTKDDAGKNSNSILIDSKFSNV